MVTAHSVAKVVSILVTTACLSAFGCGADESATPFSLIDHIEDAERRYNRKQFLSLRNDARLSLPLTLNDETRLTLAPPIPSQLAFHVRIPPNPVLRLAIALNPLGESKFWPPVEFRVLLETESQVETLFMESLNRTQAGKWLDREIDLSNWEGRCLKLILDISVDRPRDRVLWTSRRVMPLWGNPVLSSGSYRGDRPNLLLVSIDCLRADHVGAYGYSRATTPNIDALAADGTIFEAAYSTSSWTLPTHFSMLTGLLPSFHGVTRQQKLSEEVPYLPQLLSRAGYQVDGVASWYFVSQHFGFDRGFHTYRLMVGSPAERVVDTAIELARRAAGTNQFLFVHFIDPHWPYLPPKNWLERFGRPPDISDLLDKIFNGGSPRDQAEIDDAMSLYDAEIGYTDEQLGRLIDELKARGQYEDTLIVVTADHGEAFYEHGHWQHTVSLYDEVVRIPLIVKWPDNRPSTRVEIPVSQIDIFPTILQAAGLDSPETHALDLGRRQAGVFGERGTLSELTHDSVDCPENLPPSVTCLKVAMRVGTLKYIATVAEETGQLRVVRQEMYDLSKDPKEQNDLSRTGTADTEAFLARIRSFMEMAKARRLSGEEVILDDETRESLRSLGYIN